MSVALISVSSGDLTFSRPADPVLFIASVGDIDVAAVRAGKKGVKDIGDAMNSVGNGSIDGLPCVSRVV